MTKQEKVRTIEQAINDTEICRCYFTYDERYFYYYPNAISDKLFLGQEEDDFCLDGYAIRKLSHIKKVEIKNDKCNEINKENGLTSHVVKPNVDISSWQTVFNSLKDLDTFVIVEDEINDSFAIGTIQKVLKNKLYFRDFDADGIWNDLCLEIPYSQITCVKWNTRYSSSWEKYLKTR